MKNLWRLAGAYALYIWVCGYTYDHLDGLLAVEFGFFTASGGLVLPFLMVAWLDWRRQQGALRAKVKAGRPGAPSGAARVTEVTLGPKMEVLDERRYDEWSVEDWALYYSRDPKYIAWASSQTEKAP